MTRSIFIAALAFAFLPEPAHAQKPEPADTIRGRVLGPDNPTHNQIKSGGIPVPGVTVIVSELKGSGSWTATSDSAGNFIVITAGQRDVYLIRAEKKSPDGKFLMRSADPDTLRRQKKGPAFVLSNEFVVWRTRPDGTIPGEGGTSNRTSGGDAPGAKPPAGAGDTVKGKVVTPEGAPAESVVVTIQKPRTQGWFKNVVSDKDGKFSAAVEGRSDTYEIFAEKQVGKVYKYRGRETVSRAKTSPAFEIVVKLWHTNPDGTYHGDAPERTEKSSGDAQPQSSGPDTIRGQTFGPDSAIVPGVSITVQEERGQNPRTVVSDSQGKFVIPLSGHMGQYELYADKQVNGVFQYRGRMHLERAKSGPAFEVRVYLWHTNPDGTIRADEIARMEKEREGAQPQLSGTPDTIRGRVMGPDSVPISGAIVAVRIQGQKKAYSTQTDTKGQFTLILPGRAPAYELNVLAIGMASVQRPLTRSSDNAPLVVTVVMSKKAAVELQEVQVTAAARSRIRLDRRDGLGGDSVGGRREMVPLFILAQPGDLIAAAAMLPGVLSLSNGLGGFSVLGAGPTQNSIVLDGSTFTAGQIPRIALNYGVQIATSSFDPAMGQFSGARLSAITADGTNFVISNLLLSLTGPSLQQTDRAGVGAGQQFRYGELNAMTQGAIVRDRLYYYVAAEGSRRASDLTSLLSGSTETLRGLGIAPDSLQRLRSLLGTSGIPLSVAGVSSDRVNDNLSILGKLTRVPDDQHSYHLRGDMSWARTRGLGITAAAFPGHGGDQTTWGGGLQLAGVAATPAGRLNDFRSYVRIDVNHSDPYLAIPDGRVLVLSDLGDGESALANVSFGGNAGLNRNGRTAMWETMDELSWSASGDKKRRKISGLSRFDYFSEDPSANRFGTFTYASLTDLEAGRPLSFSRTLGSAKRSATSYNAAVSFGEVWRVPKMAIGNAVLQYGARVEGTHYFGRPEHNADLEERLGVRTDEIPSEVHVSPRLGFNFMPNGPRGRVPTFSGGIGEFRGINSPALIASAMDATGLPSDVRQLLCLGAAVPTPDWTAYGASTGSIPTACANGSTPTFAVTQPNVLAFDKSFRAPRSWRANLNLNFASVPLLPIRLDLRGTYSLGRAQLSAVDANFSGTQLFTLNDEGGRPVYASPGAIVPTSGAVSPQESRITDQYAQVLSYRSDGRTEARSITIEASPAFKYLPFLSYHIVGSYTYGVARDRTRGYFGGTTASDPRAFEWSESPYSQRHQFILRLNGGGDGPVTWASMMRFVSGVPFTPVVNADVNGDGIANDRAFVFNPLNVPDGTLASGMNALLDGASSSARDCLRRQIGKIASRNSCSGPWGMTWDIVLNGPKFNFGPLRRTSASLVMTNVAAGLDQLFHDRLRGWGQTVVPDQTLLTVRGFEPTAQRYQYEVNPRFGDTRPSSTALRNPFVARIEFQTAFGPNPDRQKLLDVLRPGGAKLSAAELRQRLMGRAMGNPVSFLTGMLKDDLFITDEQLTQLRAIEPEWTREQNVLWTPLSEELVKLEPKDYTPEVQERVIDMYLQAARISIKYGAKIREILSPVQYEMIPSKLLMSMEEKGLPMLEQMYRSR
jgi:hypothetical protein